ncbi:MAG: phenylalanine--tRNA ligase subunit beta [Saprospiraceae bacterium]
MKASYNWLKSYLNTRPDGSTIDIPVVELGDILTEIGLEVEGIDEHESIKGGLKGLVIGHVLDCKKHENSDKLSVTKVDLGNGEPVQIVCGAPNVAAGQKVVVATVGTTLYTADGGDFKIKKSKIRGEVSMGMICAEDEIGLGASHDGIMVLDADATIGTPAAEYFNIETDYVFDIGLTPNRSDATAHIGVAEDLAAYLTINNGYTDGVNYPEVGDLAKAETQLPIEVVIENEAAAPRYAGVCINNITIKASPEWLQNRLKSIDVRPINNVVDITNFVLHEFGQPLHAFDYEKIGGQKIIVKNLPKGSKFLCLDEVERELHEDDLMICDGDSKGMCMGGVFGGLTSGVSESTTSIFLESAYFEPMTIRRTSMRHTLRTDAAKVFEKGADPTKTVDALKRAVSLIQELAGGEVASDIIDLYPNPVEKNQITFAYANVNRLIGQDLSTADVDAILAALNIEFVERTETGGTVAIPTNKFEVTREADLIEEILRIYGFNKVDIPTSIKSSVVFSENPNPYQTRNTIADFLAANGLNEMMNMSLIKTSYKELLSLKEEDLVFINNTSNQNMDLMRPNMIFSGLDTILHNQNYQNRNLRLFEFGKSYLKSENGFKETEHLTIFLTGQKHEENWLQKGDNKANYYTLKALVNNVLGRLGLNGYQTSVVQDDVFSFGLKYHRGPQTLVTFGRVSSGLTKKFSLKQEVFFADFNWKAIFKSLKKSKVVFQEIGKYPSVRRDLALVIDKSINFEDIAAVAYKNAKKILQDVNLFDVYENEERLGKGKKSYAVSFVFKDTSKTLKDKEVEKVMNKLIKTYEHRLNAIIRK